MKKKAKRTVMLERINGPEDIKNLSDDELQTLSAELRHVIIKTVSENGGHLASNLGFVEATLAIHRVFDAPRDKIIFDVSHQSYAHKIITGRREEFSTLRKTDGISGFTNPHESRYDPVFAGHSGSSISTALGFAAAAKNSGSGAYAVAVVGDGSFTNGMIYEAINNCAERRGLNLIIILNDNKMSISENVGGISRHLTRARTSREYLTIKHSLDDFFAAIPVVGRPIAKALKWVKDSFKRIFIRDTLFENLGIPYVGPVDGHDIARMTSVLTEAKERGGVWLIHIVTKKGLGYKDAEDHPEKYHSTGKFDPKVGITGTSESFTSRFGETLCRLAGADRKICAVTGAMRDGTGLTDFFRRFPDRAWDVGIAEEHAVAYCGGLSLSGMNPVFAVYSTFAQRVFDQVFHDVALNGAHITLALDHCGIVPGDGVTHQGVFDVPLFSPIPNTTIYSPETYSELDESLSLALAGGGVRIVRYPKGGEHVYDRTGFEKYGGSMTARLPDGRRDAVIVTYGIIAEEAARAADALAGEYGIGVVKLIRVHPIDGDALLPLLGDAKVVYVLEEGMRSGGVGEALSALLATACGGRRVVIRAIDESFVPNGDRESLLARFGLDARSVEAELRSLLDAPGGEEA